MQHFGVHAAHGARQVGVDTHQIFGNVDLRAIEKCLARMKAFGVDLRVRVEQRLGGQHEVGMRRSAHVTDAFLRLLQRN